MESSLAYSPPTMAAKRLNLPPVPSTVASFTLFDAPLSTPAGWGHRPTSLRSSLARDNDDDSDVHRCSCRCVVVVLVVMLVVVLLLSVVPSRRCCPRRRCHRRTTNAQWSSPSLRPPSSLLPSQSHLLQLSPPPSPHCHFHRCRRRGYHPTTALMTQIPSTQLLLAVAVAAATAVVAAIAVAFAAAIAAAIGVTCHHHRSLQNKPIFWCAA